jgi:phosphotransferase system HPr (HPr) family protein
VQTIQPHKGDVWITVDGQSSPVVNGRSIMDILILGAVRGTKLKFRVEGEDENKILSEIEALFLNNFNEGPRE